MSAATLWLLCLLRPSPQDSGQKEALRWTLSIGAAKEISWVSRMTLDSTFGETSTRTDVEQSFTALFTSEAIDAEGTVSGSLRLKRAKAKGPFEGKELDIEFENGAFIRPAEMPPHMEGIRQALDSTSKARITTWGAIYNDHPFLKLFSGRGALGPTFPKKAVGPGDDWLHAVDTQQSMKGNTELWSWHRFREWTELNGRRCARIIVDDRFSFKVMEATVEFTLKKDAHFDPRSSDWVKSRVDSDLKLSGFHDGRAFSAKGTMFMEVTSKNARD